VVPGLGRKGIKGAYSIKSSIIYGIGPLDCKSNEADVPLLVQQHGNMELLQQSKWRCVLRENVQAADGDG
jgi:hypothetical protein